MNRKQAIIIVALLALIVCAGVLATRLNSPLYVNGTDSTVSFNTKKTNNSTTTDFFAEAKLTRDQQNNQTLQTLKALIDDNNVSKENKADAEKKYTKLALDTNNEQKVETALKAKGYEEAICQINDDKVTLIVKGKDKLTDKETREIKNEVLKITKLSNVDIECKQ